MVMETFRANAGKAVDAIVGVIGKIVEINWTQHMAELQVLLIGESWKNRFSFSLYSFIHVLLAPQLYHYCLDEGEAKGSMRF